MNTCSTLFACLVGLGTAQEPLPELDKSEVESLVEEYLQLGSRAMAADRERQLAIAARLASQEDLDDKALKRWRKDLLERWEDLPGLPEEKGDHFYWEKEQRGRYIVGGKRKGAKGLLIGMHGGGVGSADAGSIAVSYDGPASAQKWTAVFPQAIEKTERGFTDSGTEEWICDLIEQARRSFGIDADHVYMAGHSMGGYGAWTLGAHHADRVAALAPSAGAPTPILDRETDAIIDIDWGVVPNLRNVPMVVYQSIDDPRVPPDVNQWAVREVERAKERWGGYENFTYWEVDGMGHDMPPGGPEKHFEKIEDFVREPVQDDVVWQPVLDWKRQFYWLFWEEPSIGAIVVGHIDRDQNAVEVDVQWHDPTRPGKGLAVLLDERLVDLSKAVTVTFNGKEVWNDLAVPRLEVLLDTSTSGDAGRQYSAKVSCQGE